MTSGTIARDLLDIGAVFLRPDQPFTWASGIQSPIYCDNRLILTAPRVRARVADGLAALIQATYPTVELLMGMATAGIPHAALAAERLDLPMGYVRSSAKDHGRGNQIEGRLTPGQKVVLVEDLISTGGSVFEAVDALLAAGADILGVACIFTYNMEKARDRFAKAALPCHSLTDFDALIQTAAEDGRIAPTDIQRLLAFRDNPSDPAWINISQ